MIDISEIGPTIIVLFANSLFKSYDSVCKKCWFSVC